MQCKVGLCARVSLIKVKIYKLGILVQWQAMQILESNVFNFCKSKCEKVLLSLQNSKWLNTEC